MKRLMIMMAFLVAQSPAYAISSQWEEDHPKKAIFVWAITMPWRVTIRTGKLIAREVLATHYLIRGYGPPQWADMKSAIELGDR